MKARRSCGERVAPPQKCEPLTVRNPTLQKQSRARESANCEPTLHQLLNLIPVLIPTPLREGSCAHGGSETQGPIITAVRAALNAMLQLLPPPQ
jgi:hypothetical protein